MQFTLKVVLEDVWSGYCFFEKQTIDKKTTKRLNNQQTVLEIFCNQGLIDCAQEILSQYQFKSVKDYKTVVKLILNTKNQTLKTILKNRIGMTSFFLMEKNFQREKRLKSFQKDIFKLDENLTLPDEKEFNIPKGFADRRNSQPVMLLGSVKTLYSEPTGMNMRFKQEVLSNKLVDASSLIDGSEAGSFVENQEISENELGKSKPKHHGSCFQMLVKKKEKISLLDKVKLLESNIEKLEEVKSSDQ